ncbi:hypothetical protein [Hymenobacter koreensis]|uniref:Uncharacterized protein n=1 Tax=Hymenobacter koreensis TaxID=1084523 RepID=A0ABP8JKA8_9BACT
MNHQPIQDLLDNTSARNKSQVQQAYERGYLRAVEVLSKPSVAAPRSPAELPAVAKALCYHVVMQGVLLTNLPTFVYDFKQEIKMRLKQILERTHADRQFLLDLLVKHAGIQSTDSRDAKQAWADFFDGMDTLGWEAFDALLSSPDPMKAVQLLRLAEAEGYRIETDTQANQAA